MKKDDTRWTAYCSLCHRFVGDGDTQADVQALFDAHYQAEHVTVPA